MNRCNSYPIPKRSTETGGSGLSFSLAISRKGLSGLVSPHIGGTATERYGMEVRVKRGLRNAGVIC